MVTLLLDSTRLEVVLSATERALAFHKGNVIVPRETIAKVQLIDDPWTWVRGIQSPGTRIPGVIAMGTWKSVNGEDFVIVRRHRPGVVIDLEGHPEFDRVVLTTRHGLALVQSLHVDAGEQPADVVDLATGAVATTADAEPTPPAKKAAAKPKPAATPKKPAPAKPAASKPAASKPATSKPAARKPATAKPSATSKTSATKNGTGAASAAPAQKPAPQPKPAPKPKAVPKPAPATPAADVAAPGADSTQA
ncbi:hypothetical protein [Microbacterium pullorum]|uniref:hypothetical protein n=1 Tax=Microbacterium pullorum TaxID=2762236 RepID=UPI001CD851BF|nr:hypothetical protein [Microbacterium pullorum]